MTVYTIPDFREDHEIIEQLIQYLQKVVFHGRSAEEPEAKKCYNDVVFAIDNVIKQINEFAEFRFKNWFAHLFPTINERTLALYNFRAEDYLAK